MNIDELYSQLKILHEKLRMFQKEKFDRCVSFENELFDRWEKAKFLGFGEATSIYQDSLVIGNVNIGRNTWVGPYTILDGSGNLTIGNNCSISSGVQIYTHDTVKKRISNGASKKEIEPTIIGDSCYIGPLAVIQKGVTIGNHVIIGALSFVNKDIPSYTIAYGQPCKPVGKIEINKAHEIKFIYYDVGDTVQLSELSIELHNLKKELNKLRKEIKLLKGAKHEKQ